MMPPSNILIILQSLIKFYDQSLEEIRKKYSLSHIEITIISFLHNNKGHDTATEIADMRMLQKGNVSSGVELLIQKSYLMRTPDTQDRRRVHLSLTDYALPIVLEIEKQNERVFSLVFSDMSHEELELYAHLNERIQKNIIAAIEKEINK